MNRIKLCVLVCFMVTAASSVCAQNVIAFMGMENLGGDPRHDYIGGLSEGLLLYDFSRTGSITTVNRAHLDAVMEEQRLGLSGLTDRDNAVRVGRLTGADSLLFGGYTFLGREVLFSLTVVDVETGEARTVASRGSGENSLHDLAEQAVVLISGETVSFVDGENDRSILSLKDTAPGTIEFYSRLIDAEIYLDGSFAGYTTGDSRVPFLIEDVPPGRHRVETRLGADFGMVVLPEVLFMDWQEEVEVRAGKKSIVRANESHFNEVVYRLMYLCSESETLYDGSRESWTIEEDISFIDRKGEQVPGELRAEALWNGGNPRFEGVVRTGNEEIAFSLAPGNESFTGQSGVVRIEASLSKRWENSADVRITVTRSDLYQGMHRDEGKTP